MIPTTRPQRLAALLERLRSFPGRVIVVDGRGRAPAAARNDGWRRSSADWVVFLDDDVRPTDDWQERLARDLDTADTHVAGVQGRVTVPMGSRTPTDWERTVKGLESARWATADMAYRRSVLELLGGFDERFPRAYREDSDLALRALRAGYGLRAGARRVVHPVGPARFWVSVARQAGNADDARMRAKHGPGWREEVGAPAGRLRRHGATVAAGLAAACAAAQGRRRVAGILAGAWLGGTLELLAARSLRGPRTRQELATMAGTTPLLAPAAVVWSALGWIRSARLALVRRRVRAVLFDRDGTLVEDVPYNGDERRVVLRPGAREAVRRCRAAGIRVAVVTNQSGIGRGLVSAGQVAAVNAEVERQVGPIDAWVVCPHAPDDRCGCRKPEPGLVRCAARLLGVRPDQCAVIGDIGADVEAARRAGARGVLVPTSSTRRAEVVEAPFVATGLCGAVSFALGGRA